MCHAKDISILKIKDEYNGGISIQPRAHSVYWLYCTYLQLDTGGKVGLHSAHIQHRAELDVYFVF